jgi:GntR family transcriptional repressor for pyruvate dehydrogenase complex
VVGPVGRSVLFLSQPVNGRSTALPHAGAHRRQRSDRPASTPPAKRTPVPEGIANQLYGWIVDGTFRPGQLLPSERELAKRLKVSRDSVRDAIRRLEIIGVLRTRHGQGTSLCELSVDNLVTPLASVLAANRTRQDDLTDVRRMFEPAVAWAAATRASERDLDDISAILADQRRRVRARQPTIGEDTAFHGALARATHNPVVVRIMETLNALLVESRMNTLQRRGRPLRSLRGHEAVLDAIRRRNADAAAVAMRKHIDEIHALLQQDR